MIEYTKKHVIGYRNIYLIPYDPEVKYDYGITINEKKFPFTINDVEKYHGKRKRNGWYLQQLLKLYAGNVIENILDTYLVIDSDTFFLKPTSFLENRIPLYSPSSEYHEPYFEHMKKMHPSLRRVNVAYSGISHHMIFQKIKINQLFKLVEEYHGNIKKFWEIFLESVTDYDGAGASEYEIYYNYLQLYHKNDFKNRILSYKNSCNFNDGDYDFISCHSPLNKHVYRINKPKIYYKIKKILKELTRAPMRNA